MKIAVSATGPTLDADVDPRFGRCQFFIFVNMDTMEFKSIDNEGGSASGGAGIAAAQAVLNEGVNAALTGNIGPKAYRVLSEAGIQVFTGATGSVRNAIEVYKSGGLKATSGPTVDEHAGMKPPK